MVNRGLAFKNKTIGRSSESQLITRNRSSNIVDNLSLQCYVLVYWSFEKEILFSDLVDIVACVQHVVNL